jgi:alpha-galactosidase
MTIRIAFIGAGSTVFMKNIAGDCLHVPALRDATFALMDIDPKRLEESEVVARKLIQSMGSPAKVETTTDRRRALAGADFVVTASRSAATAPRP